MNKISQIRKVIMSKFKQLKNAYFITVMSVLVDEGLYAELSDFGSAIKRHYSPYPFDPDAKLRDIIGKGHFLKSTGTTINFSGPPPDSMLVDKGL